MIKIILKWWMAGIELSHLKNAAQIFFDQVGKWAQFPLNQLDPENCSVSVLSLISWQRGIDRFNGEPERQYRLRVKYAYANAADAGSVIGFTRIFNRLEVGAVSLVERLPDRDFDIITLELSDSVLAENFNYLSWLIRTYGRTCRRYQWQVNTPIFVNVNCAFLGCDYANYYCS